MKSLAETIKLAKATASMFGYPTTIWKAGPGDYVAVAGTIKRQEVPRSWVIAARVSKSGDVIRVVENPPGVASKSLARFIVSSKAMMKGGWKVEDTTTGQTARSGFSTRSGAQKVADSLNEHGPEGISGSRNPASYKHKRLRSGMLDKRSLRTVRTGKKGVKVIVGCPAGKFDAKRKRCKVGTRAKAVLTPVNPKRRKTSVRHTLMGLALNQGVPFASAAKQTARVMAAVNRLSPGQSLTVRVGKHRARITA